MDCERLETCIFFNDQMGQMPAVGELLKSQFCRGMFSECAAFRWRQGLAARMSRKTCSHRIESGQVGYLLWCSGSRFEA
jgi:hypothetical protein